VNATTGAVLVQDGSLLDRETRSIYYANLQAKDGGNLVSTTVLEITLLDDNDMTPIVTGSYFISVQEGQNVTTQIQVCATGGEEDNGGLLERSRDWSQGAGHPRFPFQPLTFSGHRQR